MTNLEKEAFCNCHFANYEAFYIMPVQSYVSQCPQFADDALILCV